MGQEAIGLGGGALGDLDRVEAVRAARFGELEGERDVDRAEGVLVQLHQLGGLGGGDAVQALARVAQHGGSTLAALLPHATEHPRGLQLLVRVDAGVDALGGERDEHVLPDAQAALCERLGEQLAGGADVGGRGQHERLAGAGVAHDRGARVTQDPRVGRQLLVDRGGHADQHQVGGVERLDAVGEHEPVARQVAAQVALLALQQLCLAAADRAQTGARTRRSRRSGNRRCAARSRWAGRRSRGRRQRPRCARPAWSGLGGAAAGRTWGSLQSGGLWRGQSGGWLWHGGPLLARGLGSGRAEWSLAGAVSRPLDEWSSEVPKSHTGVSSGRADRAARRGQATTSTPPLALLLPCDFFTP